MAKIFLLFFHTKQSWSKGDGVIVLSQVVPRVRHCHLLESKCNTRNRNTWGFPFFHSTVIFSTGLVPLYRESAGHHVVFRSALSHRPGSFSNGAFRSCLLFGSNIRNYISALHTVLARLSRDTASLNSATSDH